jgi:fructose-1,6-bisphosphatase I / sedoheptulose-1,7-bisphosphatase
MLTNRTTLTQFLIEERKKFPASEGDLNGLVLDVALACKSIASLVARGDLAGILGAAGVTNVQGEQQQQLDVRANDNFLRSCEWGGHVAGMVSEEIPEPYVPPTEYHRGHYLLAFDPLDGSSNIDVNLSVGSVFSILRAPNPGKDATAEDFLQPGTEQVAAGYAIYGPSTMIVLSMGDGVHGFTLEPSLGEFFLTHPDMRVPSTAKEFAINSSNYRFWEPAVRRYVDECLAGTEGPRDHDFNMRWVASLVAEAHRILTRGGVFLYPSDSKRTGRLRLLYEANPIGYLIEQAGGRASTGRAPILDVQPSDIHERVGFVFGAAEEVDRIEAYHAESYAEPDKDIPLYAQRGLFRTT